jgi:hypothetical protein
MMAELAHSVSRFFLRSRGFSGRNLMSKEGRTVDKDDSARSRSVSFSPYRLVRLFCFRVCCFKSHAWLHRQEEKHMGLLSSKNRTSSFNKV